MESIDRIEAYRELRGLGVRGQRLTPDGLTATVVADARSDSFAGKVMVAMPAHVITADGTRDVEAQTTVDVRDGDRVQVTIADKSMVVTGVVGGGDRTKDDVDDAVGKADDAVGKADDAVQKAEDAHKQVEDAQGRIDEVEQSTEQVRKDAQDAKEEADQASKDAQQAAQAAGEASARADAAASRAEELAGEITDVKVTTDGLTTKVEGAVTKADEALSMSTETSQTVGEIRATAQSAYTKADTALTQSTEAKQTASEIKATADRAFEDAQGALTQSSQAVQTANQVKTTVETTYLSKSDAGKTYASKSELTQTSEQIRSEVSRTYSTKEQTQEAVDDIVIGARNWALGTAKQAGPARNCQYDVSPDGISAGDWVCSFDAMASSAATASAYVNDDSGQSRVGVQFGDVQLATSWQHFELRGSASKGYAGNDQVRMRVYGSSSYALVSVRNLKLERGTKATDWTPAPEDLQAAGDYATSSAITQTAEAIRAEVASKYQTQDGMSSYATNAALQIAKDSITKSVASTYQTKDGMESYAKTSEVKATTDAIKSSVTKVSNTASSALTKATSVEQTATGLETRITQVAEQAAGTEKDVTSLETLIRQTKDGVEVGQLLNGNKVGPTALVNAAGSFDVVSKDGGLLVRVNQGGASFAGGAVNMQTVYDDAGKPARFGISAPDLPLHMVGSEKSSIAVNTPFGTAEVAAVEADGYSGVSATATYNDKTSSIMFVDKGFDTGPNLTYRWRGNDTRLGRYLTFLIGDATAAGQKNGSFVAWESFFGTVHLHINLLTNMWSTGFSAKPLGTIMGGFRPVLTIVAPVTVSDLPQMNAIVRITPEGVVTIDPNGVGVGDSNPLTMRWVCGSVSWNHLGGGFDLT